MFLRYLQKLGEYKPYGALRTVTLVHLSNETADPEQILKEIKEAVVWDDALVQIARPGLEVNLDLCPF